VIKMDARAAGNLETPRVIRMHADDARCLQVSSGPGVHLDHSAGAEQRMVPDQTRTPEVPTNVRFGSNADIQRCTTDVRFTSGKRTSL